MKHRFIIIGMDDNRSPFFPPEALAQIRKGKVFSGGIRHKEIVGPLLPAGAEWISITVPLDRVFSRYEEIFARFEETATDDSIIVFASGDPLFFGFANTIKRKLPEADILLYPAFNSLQTLAHRLVMPYDDMRTVSLTGRPWQEFDRALIEHAPKIGILTDREHTPATIADRMLEYGYSHYTLYIGEHLGNPEKERIRRMTPREAVAGDFEHPNCLLLDSHSGQCRTNSLHGSEAPDFPVRPFGIPDEEFAHLDGRARMITKA
ncbi:precorrin-6y C5,15-methyltransferase (decarboxylating) subunit CbiE, partial [uncultured Bacteroides sp.]